MEIIIQFIADFFANHFPESTHEGGIDGLSGEIVSWLKAIAWIMLFIVAGAAAVIFVATVVLSLKT
ncbi:MAG: hypothetical protein Q4C41_01470 [Eggerthellaceae bacterium]|nr:hypothetical protein [Eggerthellaceae bacterium]